MQPIKIISGGQTGADQAALDAAIEPGIDHGGWVPKGRLTEDGPLPEKYQLQEMPTASYPERTERNVLDSDGTVIFSLGSLTGGSKLTAEMAKKNGKPRLHIDLRRAHALKASADLHQWIASKGVRVLNVAGPRASEDPGIHNDVYQAIWGLFTLDVMGAETGPNVRAFRLEDFAQRIGDRPETVEEAVEFLEKHLPLEHRVDLSKKDDDELVDPHLPVGVWLRETFGLWKENEKLLKSVDEWSGRKISSASVGGNAGLNGVVRRLKRAREDLDLNVGEGFGELNRICAIELSVAGLMARMVSAL